MPPKGTSEGSAIMGNTNVIAICGLGYGIVAGVVACGSEPIQHAGGTSGGVTTGGPDAPGPGSTSSGGEVGTTSGAMGAGTTASSPPDSTHSTSSSTAATTGWSATSSSSVGGSGGASTVGGAGAGGTTSIGTTTGGEEPQACPSPAAPLAAGDRTATLEHDGRTRSYLLHVPSGVSGAEPIPLVFDLHGAGGNGQQQKQLSGWQAIADREGFLVVYPDGVDGYWNVDDKCCGTAGDQLVDDRGLIRAIAATLSEETCIDRKRIYVSGFSNGGGLAHDLGCAAADLIAAVAPVDTDLRTDPCTPSRPISMLEFRGLADTLEPYEGGHVGPEDGGYLSPGGQGSLMLWAGINECTGSTTPFAEYCERFTECGGGVETGLCSLPGAGHGSYNNALGFDIASVAWEMFQAQPMR